MKADAVTIPTDRLLPELQAMGVLVSAPVEVRTYLDTHRALAEVVLFTCAETRRHLDSQTQLSLELYRDPEIADEYLALYVRQPVYDPDILTRLQTIRREYEGNLDSEAGWLLLTTDFQPPI